MTKERLYHRGSDRRTLPHIKECEQWQRRKVTLFAIKYLQQGSFPASVYSEKEGMNVLVSQVVVTHI